MLTITISVNGKIIKKVDAVNTLRKTEDGYVYNVKERSPYNQTVTHKPEDGAVALAKKMLECLPRGE